MKNDFRISADVTVWCKKCSVSCDVERAFRDCRGAHCVYAHCEKCGGIELVRVDVTHKRIESDNYASAEK